MKKLTKRLTAVLFAAIIMLGIAPFGSSAGHDLLGVKASAASESCLSFKPINGGAEYEIEGCKADAAGKLVLPSAFNGLPVVSIGEKAFSNCDSLTGVSIPDSVTSIGDRAFAYCDFLEAVVIPDSVTDIGNAVFCGCFSLESVTLPNGVTSLGDAAFCGCLSLKSVTLPDSVTSISSNAFYGCDSLESINANPSNPSYSSLDGVLFSKDKTELVLCPEGKIGSYAIPDGVKSIGKYAFSGCEALSDLTVPSSVTSIGMYAFYKCTALTDAALPDSVTSVDDTAFCGYTALEAEENGNCADSDGEDLNGAEAAPPEGSGVLQRASRFLRSLTFSLRNLFATVVENARMTF